jgi:hypothetical protein
MTDNHDNPPSRARTFPVYELAIVLVVLGIVASIVGPRMSRGAASGAGGRGDDAVLVGRLKSFRTAVTAYTNEHGGHPPDADRVVEQLTQYTDWAGKSSPARTSRHTLGPYLREIPAMPVGARKGRRTIGLPTDPATAWTYDPVTGRVWANTAVTERDRSGRRYSAY